MLDAAVIATSVGTSRRHRFIDPRVCRTHRAGSTAEWGGVSELSYRVAIARAREKDVDRAKRVVERACDDLEVRSDVRGRAAGEGALERVGLQEEQSPSGRYMSTSTASKWRRSSKVKGDLSFGANFNSRYLYEPIGDRDSLDTSLQLVFVHEHTFRLGRD